MNVTFRLRFATHPGQSLWLTGDHPLPAHPLPLQFRDTDAWQATIPLATPAAGTAFSYSYILRNPDGSQTTDWGRDRRLIPNQFKCSELLIIDSWNQPAFLENAFYTEPFKKVLLADRFTAVKNPAPPNPTHTFRVKAPLLEKNQTLCLLGDGPALANWNQNAPILLDRQPGEDYLSVQLDLRGQNFPAGYKYGVYDVATRSFLRFETGFNRILRDPPARGQCTIINDGFANLPAALWRGAGVAIPVFSLRTAHGFGTGEFLDLIPLADWGRQISLKLIQLLPVNDTTATNTWQDSYPYAAISAFALHPLYLNLEAVAEGKNRRLLTALAPEHDRLNRLKALDYEAVMRGKLGFLRKIFPSQKAATFRRLEYQKFFRENRAWLLPYAAFCHLRDKFATADFNQWPEHKKFDAKKIEQLAKNNPDIEFHYFVQFHLHQQLRTAVAHAHACGIVLKGDIAIGVSRCGADTWQQPELFNLDMQAGAPPDAFSDKGQNWGFPTYNWPRMAQDGFAWWKRRFAQMEHYFDAFRIDHILGFFRIWSSPAHAVEGILGYFVPALPVEPHEFPDRGIHFDHTRLTQPYIDDEVLDKIFGSEASRIREEFLVPTGDEDYSLKPEFATQRQVADHFAKLKPAKENDRLKLGLFDLISNVILFDVNGKFHFRFAMADTESFKNLPADQQAKLRDLYHDYLFRRQDAFWMREAMQKLPALKRVTNMLICGEDLGFVPPCVPEVMRDLGFLSLEIQRMPKNSGPNFSPPAKAPYLSVVTPSTHDMSTIRGWWLEDPAQTQKFFNEELALPDAAPRQADQWIVERIIRQHLTSPAMWSIFQIQELFALDDSLRRADIEAERINVPAKPNFYWRYRMHVTLEKLSKAKKFNATLSELIRDSGR